MTLLFHAALVRQADEYETEKMAAKLVSLSSTCSMEDGALPGWEVTWSAYNELDKNACGPGDTSHW